jgi:hypothetical protein
MNPRGFGFICQGVWIFSPRVRIGMFAFGASSGRLLYKYLENINRFLAETKEREKVLRDVSTRLTKL